MDELLTESQLKQILHSIRAKIQDSELAADLDAYEKSSDVTSTPGHHIEIAGYALGNLITEGKTKKVYEILQSPDEVLIISKDRITAGDGTKAHVLEGKAAISTQTTSKVFEILNSVGIKTSFIKVVNETAFIARKCEMVPIEWVTRRLATGSFLRRYPGVPEGYKFNPPLQETFFKDDANHDPQWAQEQIISAGFNLNGVTIAKDEVDIMRRCTLLVFEVLEKAWASQDCCLVDMKIEFGIDSKGEILVSDVIDSDSWRLWPSGDKKLMKDKQVYRNLSNVTLSDLDTVKRNFKWVAEQLESLTPPTTGLVVILMGSPSDEEHCRKIEKECHKLNVPSQLRVTSAHKGTEDTLNILAEYEGLGCTTVIHPSAAAIAAAQILALSDHLIWSRLRTLAFNNYVSLKRADKIIRTTPMQ